MRTDVQLTLRQAGTMAMTAELRQAIAFLAMDNAALAEHLAGLANPHLTIDRQPSHRAAWLELCRVVPPSRGAPPPGRGDWALTGTDRDQAAAAPGLIAHVAAQLGLLLRDPRDHAIGRAFLEALEPSGWLAEPPEAVAVRAGCTPARAEAVLTLLQRAEPTGLFARGLADCLRLQAEEQGILTPAFATMLAHLPLVAEGDMDALALACGCDRAGAQAMVRALRGLDPKPGAAFGADAAPLRGPDLTLRPEGDGWLVALNDATLPAVLLRPGAPGAEAATDALRAARALDHALRRRNETVLRVAAEIVARQTGLLRHGPEGMDALTLADVAQATGLHRSTISRVTAALTVALPRRTLPLRAFLCPRVTTRAGAASGPPRPALMQMLRAIVAEEDPAAPLSDDAIGRILAGRGAMLARRTVAKYRRLAGIPAREDRRGPDARDTRQGA